MRADLRLFLIVKQITIDDDGMMMDPMMVLLTTKKGRTTATWIISIFLKLRPK